MKNLIIPIILLLITGNVCAYSAEIVYPKSNNTIINSPRTFFIGSESPYKELKINGQKVDIHSSGGFWHTVDLKEGDNLFNIENGTETKVYKICRQQTSMNTAKEPEEKLYNTPIEVKTLYNNIPLRATPIDFGINRLQHFSKGIKFKVIGEKGEFYKVQLGRDDFAWIEKSSVAVTDNPDFTPAKIESYTYTEYSNKRIFAIKLNKKTPYILSDNNGLDLVIYNVEGFPYNKYEFHITDNGKRAGFNSYYKDDNELIIEVRNFEPIKKSHPLNEIKIIIDPGHGSREYGAIGCLGDKEKDINLAIALKLEDKLKKSGAQVLMTRNDDSEISLHDRVKFANKNEAQIFVSIHNNALPDILADKKRSGTEVYYFYPQSRILAKSILNSITAEMNLNNNGIKQQSFAVIRNTYCLSILIEIAYIINPDDNAKLLDEKFQEGIADSIVHGLENYLNDVQQ